MRRLRDSESNSPLMDQVQAMLDATPPLAESRERMMRVRRELDRPRGLAASLRRLPALAFAGLVVLFGASAFAAVRIFVASAPEPETVLERPAPHRAARRAEPAPQVADVQGLPTPTPIPTPTPTLRPTPTPKPAPTGVVVEAERAPARRAAARHAAKARHGRAQSIARAASSAPAVRSKESAPAAVAQREQPAQVFAPAATAQQQPEAQAVARAEEPTNEVPVVTDNERVHRAVKALRREGNPALAARLLDRVARDTPGPLAEEALSLRIEAALAQGDPRTEALAREYIARYPKGRYLRIARRALQEVE